MQYVILTYMKHLGVKVKEPRNLEQKRGRIGFLPKIKVMALLDSLAFKTHIRSRDDFTVFDALGGSGITETTQQLKLGSF